MPDQKLIDYIKQNKQKGFPDDQIRKALLGAGWKREDVDEGFKVAGEIKTQIEKPKSKWLIPIIIVVGVIILGLVAWGGYSLFKPSPSEELAEEEGLVEEEETCVDKCGDGFCNEIVCLTIGCPCPETVETCPGDCEEEPILEKEVKDCGSVVNTHIFMEPGKLTDQERNSLACFSDSLAGCDLAEIEFSGEGGGRYEIQGKDGGNCLISREIFEPASSKVCKTPMSLITASKTEAERLGQPEMLFLVIFLEGEVTDVQTGEVVNIECE